MGYYFQIFAELQVKKGSEQAFAEAVAAAKKTDQEGENWGTFDGITSDNGWIEADYDDRKWWDAAKLAQLLAAFVEPGDIRFLGEDGDQFGYEFDGHGNVFELAWGRERSKEPIIRAGPVGRKR